jgi:hypothetical protein
MLRQGDCVLLLENLKQVPARGVLAWAGCHFGKAGLLLVRPSKARGQKRRNDENHAHRGLTFADG